MKIHKNQGKIKIAYFNGGFSILTEKFFSKRIHFVQSMKLKAGKREFSK